MNLFELYATIGIKMDEFENGLKSAKEKFDGFSDKLSKTGEAMSNVGGTLTKAVTLPLAGLGTAIIKTGMDYESGMSKVQAISGATGEEMILLGQKAMEMAAKTKFSTADSAEAYQYMAMAGWKAGDMVDGLSGIMNLAAASGENLGTTSDIVTDALTAFGLKASDSGRFADVLAAASNNANTNVSMLGESFKYVAPVAGAMGYSVEDTSVALGLMANSGIKASQAGTSLRTAITNMASPTKNMAEVMDQYGISLTDADGNMLSLADVMGQLREKMGGLDESTQASAASALFGKEAMSGMLAIINAATADFDKLTEAINNSNGTTEEMASIMQDNAAGAFDRLKSAIDVLFTQLSSILLPIFTQVVEKITEWVNWFGTLDEGTQKVILTIAGVAAAVGPVLIVIGKIITALSTIGGAISSVVSLITGGITSIIGIGSKLMGGIQALFSLIMAHPVVAVVAAIIAAVVLLWNNCEAFRDAVSAIWEAIVGFFQAAAENIKSAFDGVVEFFSGVWDGIQSIFQGVAEFFGGIFQAAAEVVQAAWSAVVEFFAAIWEGIQAIFSTVAEVLGGFFSAAWGAIQSAWSSVVDFFAGVWDGIQAVFSVVAEVLGDFFSAAWEAIQAAWSAVSDFFSGVWEAIKAVFEPVAEVIGGFFKAAWEAVQSAWGAAKEFFSGIAEGIRSVFETVTEFLGETFTSAYNAVKSVWEAAKEFFAGIWNAIKEAASAAAEKVSEGFKKAWEAVKGAWDKATEFFKGIFDKIVGVFSGIGDKFKEIGGNIVNGIKNGVMGAWDAFTGFMSEKIKGIISGVKGLLGIHSPSTVFAGIGENMALGLADGWDDEYRAIKRKIEGGLNFGTATVGLRTNGGGYAGGYSDSARPSQTGAGNTFNFTFNSPKALNPVEAAREARKASQQIALGYV